jgi:O-antigen ligase
LLIGGFFVMIWWLFRMAQSSTSLVSLLLGAMIMLLVGRRFVNKRGITGYILIGLLAIAAAEMAFGLSAHVLKLLNKDSTLTDRTLLWADVLKVKINPLLGVGFESFWLGDRLKQLHENRAFQPNEAHNGYLETYLNLGLIGLFILIGLLVATYRKARLELLKNFEWGRYRLGFLVAVVLYNLTEASFKTVHPVWFAFYIIALDYPTVEYAPAAETVESEQEVEATYAAG